MKDTHFFFFFSVELFQEPGTKTTHKKALEALARSLDEDQNTCLYYIIISQVRTSEFSIKQNNNNA